MRIIIEIPLETYCLYSETVCNTYAESLIVKGDILSDDEYEVLKKYRENEV